MPGIDQFTVLMLHMNGTNGSTTFTDNSVSGVGSPHTMTAHGSAQIDTSQFEFGGASGKLGSSANYIDTPDSSDFVFGSGDFTIDTWVRFSDLSQSNLFATMINSVNVGWFCGVRITDGNLVFLSRSTNGTVNTGTFAAAPSPALAINQWIHFAFVRNGANGFIFQNGTLLTTTVEVALATVVDPSVNLLVGSGNAFTGGIGPQWQDEFRISKGIARWTAGFSVPLQQYDTYSGFNLNRLHDLHLSPNRMIAG